MQNSDRSPVASFLTVHFVVVGILVVGILLAAAYGLKSALGGGGGPSCPDNLRELNAAVTRYREVHHGSSPSSLNALTPGYLKHLPICPLDRQRATYRLVSRPDETIVYCTSEAHQWAGEKAGYPQYSSTRGLIESRATAH